MHDLVLKGGTVADPLNRFFGTADVAVKDGKIAEVGQNLAGRETADCAGMIVQPGVIDTHLHASPDASSYKAIAYAGVTSCLDMMGPTEKVLAALPERGCGISVAVCNAILPGRNVAGNDPAKDEIERFISDSLKGGAFGVKLLGGHFPLTPEATARFFAAADEMHAYAAIHAGTTEKGSNIEGFEEAFELFDGHPAHMAHINAYCRGYIDSVSRECERAERLLEAHPEVVCESYVSPRSGGEVGFGPDGLVKSHVVRTTLGRRGYSADRKGVEQALRDRYLGLVRENADGLPELVDGEEGVEWLKGRDGITCSFDQVNPILPRVWFASAKRSDGTFLVDGLSTDGGAIPRNVILALGLSVQKLGGFTPLEFAAKSSLLPARMLGLKSKGHFTAGADADVTVYDPVSQRAVKTLALGKKVLWDGAVAAGPGRMICTKAGEAAVRAAGVEPVVVEGGIPALDRRF